MDAKKTGVSPLKVEQLITDYGTDDQIETILDLRSFSSFLHETVIENDYKPSSALTRSLANLSPEGVRIRKDLGQLQARHKEKYGNTSLANLSGIYSLLNLAHQTPLLDLEKTCPDQIAEAVALEVKDRNLLIPFIFGRDIYDKFNKIQEDETSYLNYEKSIRLLGESPIGIVHLRKYLIGPWGLIQTPFSRSINARRDPFLQHSSDRTTTTPHRVLLSTSSSADVNVYQSLFYESMTKNCAEASAWGKYFRQVSSTPLDDFDERSIRTIPYLLGDALSTSELQVLFRDLVELVPFVRQNCEKYLKCCSSKDLGEQVQSLDRAELYQLILTATDQELWDSVTRLIQCRKINIPAGEIRRPVLNGHHVSGQWGVSLELGSLGLRNRARLSSFAIQRFEYLVRKVWKRGDEEYHQDISWRLRRNLEIRTANDLVLFTRSQPIPDMIDQLFNSSKRAVEECKEYLRIGISEEDSDDTVVNKIMWALGFSVDSTSTISDRFWIERMNVSRALKNRIISGENGPTVRSLLADFFPTAEEYLKQVLCYLTWVFLSDHFTSHDALEYKESVAETFTSEALFSGILEDLRKLTLGKVPDRFKQLARQMEDALSDPEPHVRPDLERPRFVEKTSLQSFPFIYKPLVLCVTEDSARSVVNKIRDFARMLEDCRIADTRNDLSHGGRSLPPEEEIQTSVNRFAEAIEDLETWGLTPAPYRKTCTTTDNSGKTTIEYINKQGLTHREFRPSEMMLTGLPTKSRKLLVMPKLLYRGTLQNVLFQPGFDSKYAVYWDNYPIIPENSDFLPAGDETANGEG